MSAYQRLLNLWANGALSPRNRVRKLSGTWYVEDAERPGQLLHGPSFKTRTAAEEYARANMRAVLERLREAARC